MPGFCVVMPMYKAAGRVEQAVQSVQSQTCQNFRLNVVDDGSSAVGVERIQSLVYSRISIIENGVNQGIECF